MSCSVTLSPYYRCESWSMTKQTLTSIEAMEMWFLRRMLRVSWTEKRTNKLFRNSKYSKKYKKAYKQRQEKTSRISRPCDEKGKARAFVDNRKDRRKKKQRSSKNKIQDGIAAWLGRSTAEMFMDARDREKWKVMIAYAGNRHGN